jgi:hypothetical protein
LGCGRSLRCALLFKRFPANVFWRTQARLDFMLLNVAHQFFLAKFFANFRFGGAVIEAG